MAAGDAMLDASGNEILEADGDAQLSDGAGDDCCCGGTKKCFQQWTAYWDCDLLEWVLTPGEKDCLSETTSTDWIGSGCTGYSKWVKMSDDACTSDGDCGSLPDTATPDPPFPGEPPDCYCPCLSVCGCRNVGRTATVSFSGVLNGMACTDCGGTFRKAGTLILGTYTLTKGVGCTFTGTATGVIFLTATGTLGGDCPPDEDFTPGESSASIELFFDAITGKWAVNVFADDFQLFLGAVDQGDCTGALVIDNEYTDYDPCGFTTFAVMKDGTATVVFKPCTP